MKHAFTFLILFTFLTSTILAEDFEGYIVTKDGIRLTGQIGDLNQNLNANWINFVNDFGDSYYLAPELIKGFVFQQDTTVVAFESKFDTELERWTFMQVVSKGPGLNLYSVVTDRSIEKSIYEENSTKYYKAKAFYLEAKGKFPQKVLRMGFKKQLTDLIKRRAPKFADKIGSRNYRYRDLINIIDEYNAMIRARRKLL